MAHGRDDNDLDNDDGVLRYHPRDKQDVAERLVLGALHMAYGHHDVTFQGPFPTSFQKDRAHKTLSIEYDHCHTPLDIRNSHGFEVSVFLARSFKVTKSVIDSDYPGIFALKWHTGQHLGTT